MIKIEKMEYDENRVKMYSLADVIKEMIAKMNEIIDVVNSPRRKDKKEKEKLVVVKGEEKEYEIDGMGFARSKTK